jgi:transposase-like protein
MSKMARRTYDDKFRASAVVMLEAAGYPDTKGALTKVANHLKVPARTLSRWFNKENNPPPDDVVKVKKGQMIEQLENLAYKLIAAIHKEIDENGAPVRESSTALGIVIDKRQLLMGGATSRNEINIKEMSDDELRAIADA